MERELHIWRHGDGDGGREREFTSITPRERERERERGGEWETDYTNVDSRIANREYTSVVSVGKERERDRQRDRQKETETENASVWSLEWDNSIVLFVEEEGETEAGTEYASVGERERERDNNDIDGVCECRVCGESSVRTSVALNFPLNFWDYQRRDKWITDMT